MQLPTLNFESTDSSIHSFQDLSGKRIVVYFYPKDNTPGCTLEARDFAALKPEFDQLNTVIVGISRDSCQSHLKFKDKQGLPFVLISDTDSALCKAFGVLKEKSLFANTFLGIERSTFLFDETGNCRQEWRKVSAKGHAETVLQAVKKL